MAAKRIIPCLDVMNGKVVKGVNFVDLKVVGDPAEAAKLYCEQGADEIAFLDITATNEGRGTMIDVVEKTAKCVTVPLTVGGGIRNIDDIGALLDAGADKVSINSAAVRDLNIIREGALKFGSRRIVLAADVRRDENGVYRIMINGGKVDTGLEAVSFIKEAVDAGVGEVLLTSMDADGVKGGYDLEITKIVADEISVPVIASGGCGSLQHFSDVFLQTNVDAALAASVFHNKELTIAQVKEHLELSGIPVRR